MLFKLFTTIAIAMTLFTGAAAEACVGRILQVGALDTPEGRVFGEAVALMINERTGTTVETNYFPDIATLYKAVENKKIGIIIENTTSALTRLGEAAMEDHEKAYQVSKKRYRQELSLVWLDPYQFVNSVNDTKPIRTANLISNDVMQDFPGLPRLLNKLAKKVKDQDYSALVTKVKTGADPKNTAKDFLNSKKLI